MLSAHLPRAWIQRLENCGELVGVLLGDEIELVDHEHIGELDLLDQEIADGAFVLFASHLSERSERLRRAVVP